MRYSQLRAFHNVALHGGFSRAAQALNQTQPSLSEQVRRLEQDYDTLLFIRDRRRVRLTPAGEALFQRTRQFFEIEGTIRDHLAGSGARMSGTLRILADSALHVTGTLGRFRATHPGVAMSVRTGNTAEVTRALQDYEAEIGVVGNFRSSATFDAIPLGTTPIVAMAAAGFLPHGTTSLEFADLPRWPLVLRERGSHTRKALEEEAARQDLTLTPAIEVEGRDAMREVVAAGAGIGFVSKAEFGQDPRLREISIRGADLGMSETIISLAARRDVPVIAAFMRLAAR